MVADVKPNDLDKGTRASTTDLAYALSRGGQLARAALSLAVRPSARGPRHKRKMIYPLGGL